MCLRGERFFVRRTNSDFIVGGAIFISLFVLIAGVLWLKEVSVTRKMIEYTILFSNIGTLQNGDPVNVNGVKKGSVANIWIDKASAKAAVTIKLDAEVNFTDSCKVIVQNIGLMGERTVSIHLSTKGKAHKPDTKNNIVFIKGYFDSGIAEAMGLVGTVLEEVLAVVDTVKEIIHMTVGDESFVTSFNTIVTRIDSIVLMVNNLIADNSKGIKSSIDNIHIVTNDIKKLIRLNKENVNDIVDNGKELTVSALVISQRLDSVVISVNNIVTGIEDGKGSVGVLMNETGLVDDARTTLGAVDSLVKSINEDALKLRLKILGNKGYFKDTKKKKE